VQTGKKADKGTQALGCILARSGWWYLFIRNANAKINEQRRKKNIE
jgi:hypothetical protein